jgi:hypothetical protein
LHFFFILFFSSDVSRHGMPTQPYISPTLELTLKSSHLVSSDLYGKSDRRGMFSSQLLVPIYHQRAMNMLSHCYLATQQEKKSERWIAVRKDDYGLWERD